MMYRPYTEMTSAGGQVFNEDGNICNFLDDELLPSGLAKNPKEYDPIVEIQYHMNPSSAQIEKGALSFVSRDAEFITRANESKACLTVENYSVENGILTVGMTAIGSAVDNSAYDENGVGEAAVFALQAKVRKGERTESSVGRDTLITSDYAMLYSTKITPAALAFNDKDHGGQDCTGETKNPARNPELYVALTDVMGNPASFELKYNSQEGIDLKKYLEVHYVWDTKTKNAANHGVWAYGDEAEYGLHYQFDLVDYDVDGNRTYPSRYAKLNDGVITACTVDAEGNPMDAQGLSAVGREPLVRVMLLDGEGNVVLYGFVKIKIVRETSNLVTEQFPFTQENIDLCNVKDLVINWSQVSSRIFEKVGMGNEEFNLYYTLAKEGNQVVQFRLADDEVEGDGAEFTKLKADEYVGEVTERKETEGSSTTNIVWSLSPSDQQAIYETEGRTKTIYVAYVPSDSRSGLATVYLPLTISLEENAAAQTLTMNPVDKFWVFGPDGNQPGMNVRVPTPWGNPLSWSVDVHDIWEGGNVGVPEAYKDYASHVRFYLLPSETADGEFKLTVEAGKEKAYGKYDGKEYEPTAENEQHHALDATKGIYANTKVFLNGEEIANIDPVSGMLYYHDNVESRRLLNAYGSEKATDPRAFIKIGVTMFNDCNVVLPLTDDKKSFSEYVLRPINVKGNAGNQAFTDAQIGGSKINLFDVLDFNDWRGANFKASGNGNIWLYSYYQIQKVEVDESNILTNMNSGDGNFKKLVDVAPELGVDFQEGSFAEIGKYNAPEMSNASARTAISAMFGTLTYENNGNPIGNGAILRIPVKITYIWGTVTTTVDIPIKSVYNN